MNLGNGLYQVGWFIFSATDGPFLTRFSRGRERSETVPCKNLSKFPLVWAEKNIYIKIKKSKLPIFVFKAFFLKIQTAITLSILGVRGSSVSMYFVVGPKWSWQGHPLHSAGHTNDVSHGAPLLRQNHNILSLNKHPLTEIKAAEMHLPAWQVFVFEEGWGFSKRRRASGDHVMPAALLHILVVAGTTCK